MKPLERFRLRLSRSDALLAISVVGMTAGFTTGTVAADASFSQRSVYLTLMGAAGFEYRRDPMARLLNRTGVGAVIEREFAITPFQCGRDAIEHLLDHAPEWIIAADDTQVTGLLRGHDLSEFVKQLEESAKDAPVVLGDVPGAITRPVSIRVQATLQEAQEMMDAEHTDVMLVTRATGNATGDVYGAITRDAIDSSYR